MSEIKLKSRNPKVDLDICKIYFGEPYVIDVDSAVGKIALKQPTIGEIIEIGEKRFNSTLGIFVGNTTQYRLPLWENGVDWNEISDFELFCSLIRGADSVIVDMLFDNINFDNFKPYQKKTADEKVTVSLYDDINNIEINEEVYWYISQYFRSVFNIYPEEKITHDAIMKQWFIEKDKRDLKNAEEKRDKDENYSSLQNIISACVNHPGFKYKLKELKEVGVAEFYDSAKRLQVYEATTALQKGMMSGFIDGKNIKPDEYNFMRPLN